MANKNISSNDNIIKLTDGRQLGYAEYGEPGGYPVFLFHGNPGSRLSWGLFPGCPFIKGIRIIAPDRPGYGLSDFTDRALTSWPKDVKTLADHLGIDQFVVMGVSGGGPYALACAWKIPERLSAVGLVGSVGPNVAEATDGVIKSLRVLWKVSNPLYWLIKLQMKIMAAIAKSNPEKLVKPLRDLELSEQDREIFDRPEIQNIFIKDFPEAYRQNGIGSAYDTTIPAKWPIPFGEITIKIHSWNMDADQLVGKMGHYIAKKLPNCETKNIPNFGHLWILDHVRDVLIDLVPPNIIVAEH